MPYTVELTLRAERDLSYLYDYIEAADSAAAGRWFDGIERAIFKLEQFPRRGPRAPEARKAKRSLRQLLYSSKSEVYRVLYEIDEARKLVRVLTIRHGAMDEFLARE